MASRLRELERQGARLVALGLAIVLAPTLAIGCLYLLRAPVARWPGPRVPDALALDAIPHHASVPLVVFVALYALAGALLAAACRAVGLNRLAAALVLLTGVGAWSYVMAAASVFVVLQVPATEAFRRAASMQSVYLAAAIAGLAGALLARKPAAGRGSVTLIVYAVTVGAGLDLLAATVPHDRRAGGLVSDLASSFLLPSAAALIVTVAVLLFITARGLSRRNRTAWRIATALLGLSSVLQLLHGLDYADAAVSGVVMLLLVARRNDFTASSDPSVRLPALEILAGSVASAFVFALSAIVVNRIAADLPVRAGAATLGALRALVGFAPRGREYLRSGFGDWFPWAVVGIEAVGLARAALVATAPWRHQLSRDERGATRAAAIVRRHGVDTLAPFALRGDKDRFIYAPPGAPDDEVEQAVLVSYRVVRGVAIIAGDPIGPTALLPEALGAFLELARARGWKPTVLGAAARHLECYRALGLRTLYHGDEGVLDVKTFSLEGPPMRTARQGVHRVERRGYRAEVRYARDITPECWLELRALESEWLGRRAKTGFVMQLDDLARLGGTDAVFVLGRAPDGSIAGFLHLARCPAASALSLSSMPRRRETPNGFNAWLINAAAS